MTVRFRLPAFLLPLLLLAAAPPPEAADPASGAVVGVVTEAESGEPIAGATVEVLGLPGGMRRGAATDVEGRYRIEDVPVGRWSVRATFVGMRAIVREAVVEEGRADPVSFILSPDSEAEEVTVCCADAATPYEAGTPAASGAPPPMSPIGMPARSARGAAAMSPGIASPGIASPDVARPRRGETPRRPTWDPQPAPGLLTAGDVDDHLNWEHFLGWLARSQRQQSHRQAPRPLAALDLSDRVTIRIVDRVGAPVAGAKVRVTARGGTRAGGLETQAGTDGRLVLFPTYDFGEGVREVAIRVDNPNARGHTAETVRLSRLGTDREVRIQTRGEAPGRPRAMDIAFVIDVTGSMGDELRYLTSEFESIVERLEARYPATDLRFGLVAYRDHGDQFVVRDWDFSGNVQTVQGRLASLSANGGGDYPEAMEEAVARGLDLSWRPEATRLMFLVADAPPHDENTAAMMEQSRRARGMGVRVYPLAASGVGDAAELVMRTTAALTQGRHLFLTDDSGIGRPHQEPKVECFVVTKLNDLLVRVIASEIEGRRVEPTRSETIREVGDYDAGVCEAQPLANRPRPEPRADGLGGYLAPGE